MVKNSYGKKKSLSFFMYLATHTILFPVLFIKKNQRIMQLFAAENIELWESTSTVVYKFFFHSSATGMGMGISYHFLRNLQLVRQRGGVHCNRTTSLLYPPHPA